MKPASPRNFKQWMDAVDSIGTAEGIFDRPEHHPLCSGSEYRRPYRGEDGIWFDLYKSGMTPRQALGEAFVEQDGGL
jgi:hypothetical protein